MLLTKRLEYFKQKFENEENRKRWRVFYQDEFDDEKIDGNTVYFVITGEEENKKQKTVDFSIFYSKSSSRYELLNFRNEVKDFLKYLKENFETNNFYNIDNSYKIEYSTITDRGGIRVAEIQCTYDCTRDILDEENIEKELKKMEILKTMAATTGGKGVMHEGFCCEDDTRFTREWFSWANAMYAELFLDCMGYRLEK